MADNFDDNTNELIDNAAADLINATAKEQADEIRNETQGSIDTENSALQQNTSALNANTQAQKALNDEKQKTLTIQQALDKAVQESLKQRNEMMVYHGTGAKFNKFDSQYMSSGIGGQSFLEGHYFTSNKNVATDYSSSAYNHVGNSIESFKSDRDKELIESWRDAVKYSKQDGISIDQYVQNLKILEQKALDNVQKFGENAVNDRFVKYKDIANSLQSRINNIKRYQNGEHNYTPQELQQFAQNNRRENFLYYSAIPKDTGKNYFDYESIDFNDLKSRTSDDKVLSIINELEEKTYSVIGEHFITALQSANMNPLDVLKDMGFIGNKWSTSRVEGGNPDDVNYTVYDDSNARILKREVTNYERLESQLRESKIDTSLYNPITYVDESLKSAIEGSNFDGARFILDIAEAIKQKIIPADGAKLASGSFVIGPDLENFTAQKVNDLILTNDGRAYITDKLDNIIATKDLDTFLKKDDPFQNIRQGSVANGRVVVKGDIVGAINNLTTSIKDFVKLSNSIDKFTKQNSDRSTWSPYQKKRLKEYENYLLNAENLFIDSNSAYTNNVNKNFNKYKYGKIFGFVDKKGGQLFNKDIEDINNIRSYDENFRSLLSRVESLQNKEFKTFEELDLINKANNFKSNIGHYRTGVDNNGNPIVDATGLIGNLGLYRNEIEELNKALQSGKLTEIERINTLLELDKTQTKYTTTLTNYKDEVSRANSELNSGLNKSNWKSFVYSKGEGVNWGATLQSFAGSGVGKVGGLLVNILKGAKGGLAGIIAAILITAIKKAINVATKNLEIFSEEQSIKVRLETIYNSKSKADDVFEQIADYATISPFDVESISEMAVLLKQSGIYASDLMDTLKMIGDVSGDSSEKMQRIARNYSQVIANGRATTRDLREFANAGIPIYKALAEVYKNEQSGKQRTNIQSIEKLTSKGKVSDELVEKAFQYLTGEGGTFYKAVENSSKTYKARKTNLKDERRLAMANFGSFLYGPENSNTITRISLDIKETFWGALKKTLEEWDSGRKERVDDRTQKRIDKLFRQAATEEKKGNVYNAQYLYTRIQELANGKDFNTSYKTNFNKYEEDYAISGKIPRSELPLSTQNKAYLGSMFTWKNILGFLLTGELKTPYTDFREGAAKQNDIAGVDLSKYTADRYITKARKNLDKDLLLGASYFTSSQAVTAADEINKAAGRSSGLSSFAQTSADEYAKTEKGKKELIESEKKDWNEKYERAMSYYKLLDEEGKFNEYTKKSLEDMYKMQKDGFFKVEQTYASTVDELANDSLNVIKYAEGTSERLKAEKLAKESWEGISENIETYQKIASNIPSLAEDMDEVYNAMFDAQGNLIDNTKDTVSKFLAIFVKFNRKLEKKIAEGDKDASMFMGVLDGTFQKLYMPNQSDFKDYDTAHNNTVVYPLWQRILSSSLGVDTSLFKSDKGGFITNGKQAVDVFKQQSQRDTVKNISRAMLNTMGVRNTFEGRLAYSGVKYNTQNNSMDFTKQINWQQTYKNFADFATSLESAAEVTSAYADSIRGETNALKDFLSNAITQTEEPANIYDENYQKTLGALYKNMDALGANAYDMDSMFEKVSGGFLRLRENATEAAKALLEQKQAILPFVDAISKTKTEIEGLKDSIRTSRLTTDINLGKYADTKIGDLLVEQQTRFVTFMSDILDSEDFKAINVNQEEVMDKYLEYENKFDNQEKKNEYKKVMDKVNSLREQVYKEFDDYYSWVYYYSDSNKNTSDDFRKKITDYLTMSPEDRKDFVLKLANENSGPASREYLKYLKENKDVIGEYETETDSALYDLFNTLDSFFEHLGDETKAEEAKMFSEGMRNIFRKGVPEGTFDYDILNTVIAGRKVYGNNTPEDQRILDLMGVTSGKTMSQFVDSLFYNIYDKENNTLKSGFNKGNFRAFMENADDTAVTQFTMKNWGDIENFGTLESFFEEKPEALREFTRAILELIEQERTLKDVMSDLGKSVSDTFKTSIVDGFNNSMKAIGKSIVTSVNAGEELKQVWKDVGQSMLDTIGSAATNAGLNLISEGNWKAGLALIAAGGILNFASGLFENNDEEDKEEDRLKNLRDLLLEIIEQAKIDVEYYERNARHQEALSEANKISVNDAIISPSGSVITTAPDDYLIATKTPEKLVGSSGGSVTIKYEDHVGVNIEHKERKNPDGSTDVIAVITGAVAQGIADGTFDDALIARDARVKGTTYSY